MDIQKANNRILSVTRERNLTQERAEAMEAQNLEVLQQCRVLFEGNPSHHDGLDFAAQQKTMQSTIENFEANKQLWVINAATCIAIIMYSAVSKVFVYNRNKRT